MADCGLRVLQISTRLSLIHYTMGLRLYNDGGWEQAEDHVRALTLGG